jgi:hypothetical protein
LLLHHSQVTQQRAVPIQTGLSSTPKTPSSLKKTFTLKRSEFSDPSIEQGLIFVFTDDFIVSKYCNNNPCFEPHILVFFFYDQLFYFLDIKPLARNDFGQSEPPRYDANGLPMARNITSIVFDSLKSSVIRTPTTVAKQPLSVCVYLYIYCLLWQTG